MWAQNWFHVKNTHHASIIKSHITHQHHSQTNKCQTVESQILVWRQRKSFTVHTLTHVAHRVISLEYWMGENGHPVDWNHFVRSIRTDTRTWWWHRSSEVCDSKINTKSGVAKYIILIDHTIWIDSNHISQSINRHLRAVLDTDVFQWLFGRFTIIGAMSLDSLRRNATNQNE